MTDNTQELDEILFNLCDLSYASFTTQEEADRVADQLDYDRAEAKQAILDWHNKQVEKAMAKFSLKKGVKYDVKATDTVIVITPSIKPKDSYQ